MSSCQIHTFQYVCKCGKVFSCEPKRVNLLLRLHYKKCKYPRTETQIDPIYIKNSGRNGSNTQIITGGRDCYSQRQENGIETAKLLIGSL